jgi:RNA-binding protein 5/10
VEKPASLHDAVQAAATAALAAEKKEKEKAKEIKLASKSSILANKKKMNNVLSMWKQRSHEGQATRVALDDSHPSVPADDRLFSAGQSTKSKFKSDSTTTKENTMSSSGVAATPSAQTTGLESPVKPRPASNSSGGTLMGVIRGSGRGVVKSDTSYSIPSAGVSTSNAAVPLTMAGSSTNADTSSFATPFRTDVSALGSYTPPVAAGSGKRRFSEMPLPSAATHKEQPQNSYRDRAAERRSLYGSSSVGDDLPDADPRKL